MISFKKKTVKICILCFATFCKNVFNYYFWNKISAYLPEYGTNSNKRNCYRNWLKISLGQHILSIEWAVETMSPYWKKIYIFVALSTVLNNIKLKAFIMQYFSTIEKNTILSTFNWNMSLGLAKERGHRFENNVFENGHDHTARQTFTC